MASFLQLYGEYLDAELGTADRSALFTTAKRKDAIHRGQLEFVKQTGCLTSETTITIVDGTQEYDLDALAAANFLDVTAEGPVFVYTDTGGTVTYTEGEDFPRVDVPEMQAQGLHWRDTSTTSETPQSWWLRHVGGSIYFGLYPTPTLGSGDTASVKVPYVSSPYPMADDDDIPFAVSDGVHKLALHPWHMALVHYAAALLEPLRKNYQGERRQRELFAGLVADYLQKQRPKGGQRVQFARNYYRETRTRGMGARLDPRVWP